MHFFSPSPTAIHPTSLFILTAQQYFFLELLGKPTLMRANLSPLDELDLTLRILLFCESI